MKNTTAQQVRIQLGPALGQPIFYVCDAEEIQVVTNLRTTGSDSGFLRYFVGNRKIVTNTWQNTDPQGEKEACSRGT